MIETFDIDRHLNDLRSQDGKLWVRICGQTHWDFNEIPLFVLIQNRKQISNALKYLQDHLRNIEIEPFKFTIAFMSLMSDSIYNHGFLQGEEIFQSEAIDRLYPEPYREERRMTLFDAEYPQEIWAYSAK